MGHCKNGKHKFRPRYNENWTTSLEEINLSSLKEIENGNGMLRPYLKEKTYVHDVCIKCGDIAIKEQR